MRVLLALVLAIALHAQAGAAELLMFELRGCQWCERWRREVGVAYPNTPEGRRAPLRTVDIQAAPEGVRLASPVRFSPTFVLVDGSGREVGRIEGYPGADFFWGLYGNLLRRLPPPSG